MIKDLRSLLAPVSEESFLDHFLGKKRLHIKSDASTRAASLLPWATINHLIESEILPLDRLRVIRKNVEILPMMFRHGDGTQRLRSGALQALLRQGVSLIVNGIGDLVPQIARLTDAIERRLRHLTWANGYLSFSRGSAFKPHWDPHDVLVLQIHGRKRWRTYGAPMPFPVEGNGPTEPFGSEIVWEGLLEPGDVLYLPRGEVHEAVLEAPRSVHLTIGIQPPRGTDFFRWMAEKSSSDVLARMDLTRLGGEADLHRHENELKKRLHALIDETSVQAFLEAEDARRKLRPWLSMGPIEPISPATMIVPSPRRRIPIPMEGDTELSLIIGGEPFRLALAERRVMAHLLERNGLTFGELLATFGATMGEALLHNTLVKLAQQGLVGLEAHDDGGIIPSSP